MSSHDRIQSSIREVLAATRNTEKVGPFALYLSRTSSHPYANYAVPTEAWNPADGERHAAQLVAAFERHGLTPRVEAVASPFPALDEVLARAGFGIEGRLDLMTLDQPAWRHVPPPAGGELRILDPAGAPTEELRAMVSVQRAAFGEPGEVSDEDLGAVQGIGALATLDGEPASGGTLMPARLGVSEIAGIGTAERFRRRGLGAAITSALARAAFDRGDEIVFITPGDEGAGRVYTRSGFETTGEMLHMRRE